MIKHFPRAFLVGLVTGAAIFVAAAHISAVLAASIAFVLAFFDELMIRFYKDKIEGR
jgi:hypothetical protein